MKFCSTCASVIPRSLHGLRLVMVTVLLAAVMTTAGTASAMPLSPAVNGGVGCDVSSTDPGFSIGDGSSGNPFIVTNSAQLASLDVTNSANVHYRQACDLNLASYSNWAGVGETGTAFSGVYDGDGFTISNVSISASSDNWGLFRQANGATIKNLTLTDVTISAWSNVGSLIGNAVNVTVSAVTVRANVTGTNDVGGLIGYAVASVGVTGSYATGAVNGSNSVGGLIGYAHAVSGSTVGVTDSYATGAVTGTNRVGGLIGSADAVSGSTLGVTGSYATGAVNGSVNSVGGLIGDAYANDGSVGVSNSYATGTVTGTNRVGGLIGSADADGGSTMGVTGSYATGAVTGSNYVGGLIGYAHADGGSTLGVTGSYATGDVTGDDWYVGGLIGYAYADGSGSTVGVTGSYASGTVTGSGNRVGGLIGNAYAAVSGSTLDVTGSYATGDVNGSNSVGGLIGSAEAFSGSTMDVSNSYATGTVNGTSSVGGLIGWADADGSGSTVTVSASFWDITTSGVATSAGGDGKTTEQMQMFDTFDGAGWSITQFDADQNAVWGICDGLSYAYLRWESQRPSACSSDSSDQTTPPAPSTTAPPTTVVPVDPAAPPTTVAPVDPAAPVLVNGVLPELSAGEVIVYENGAVITVEPDVENNTDLVLRDPGFELRLTFHCTNGCNIQTISDGRHVVTLEQHNVVNVNGRYFQPGSTVYVWLFSAPILLGQLTVNTDGTITGQVTLGDIAPGNHTLQINAINSQGDILSINIGVIVIPEQAPTPAAGVLPATGTNTTPIWLLALTLLGLGLVTTSRRRRASHN